MVLWNGVFVFYLAFLLAFSFHLLPKEIISSIDQILSNWVISNPDHAFMVLATWFFPYPLFTVILEPNAFWISFNQNSEDLCSSMMLVEFPFFPLLYAICGIYTNLLFQLWKKSIRHHCRYKPCTQMSWFWHPTCWWNLWFINKRLMYIMYIF